MLPTTCRRLIVYVCYATVARSTTTSNICRLASTLQNMTAVNGWSCVASVPLVPVCDWFGVTCDTNSQITELKVYNSYLQGNISSLLALIDNPISTLQVLDIVGFNLSTSLPSTIAQLTAITSLSIRCTPDEDRSYAVCLYGLTGSIPLEIFNMTQLLDLRLGQNSLTGPIPTLLGRMTRLTLFEVSYNNLRGKLSCALTILFGLMLHHTVGTLPTEIGMLTGLLQSRLRNNLFSGTIPSEIGELAACERWGSTTNQLEGN